MLFWSLRGFNSMDVGTSGVQTSCQWFGEHLVQSQRPEKIAHVSIFCTDRLQGLYCLCKAKILEKK